MSVDLPTACPECTFPLDCPPCPKGTILVCRRCYWRQWIYQFPWETDADFAVRQGYGTPIR